jgi:hypothetical protein
VTILPAELRELSAREGDIQAMSATAITIRALRQLGVACAPPVLGGPVTGRVMLLHRGLFYGEPLEVETDSLLVFYEGDAASRADDGWVRARPVGVSATGVCPDSLASPAFTLVADLALPDGHMLNRANAIAVGAPLRGFQTLTYRSYRAADGDWYLGLQPREGSVQPLVGPLAGAHGFRLRYFNARLEPTGERDSVAAIEITVRGRTADRLHEQGGPGLAHTVDSITTLVTLWNNPRF